MRRRLTTALLGCLLTTALPAAAQLGLYAGASVGQASYEADFSELELRIDDDDFAWKVLGGLKIGRHFGLEASYRDLGAVGSTVDGVALGASAEGLDATLVGRYKLGPVTIFGKAGVFFWDGKLDLDDVRLSSDGSDLVYGVGASLKLLGLGIRAEYEVLDADVADLSMLSVGVTFGF